MKDKIEEYFLTLPRADQIKLIDALWHKIRGECYRAKPKKETGADVGQPLPEMNRLLKKEKE